MSETPESGCLRGMWDIEAESCLAGIMERGKFSRFDSSAGGRVLGSVLAEGDVVEADRYPSLSGITIWCTSRGPSTASTFRHSAPSTGGDRPRW